MFILLNTGIIEFMESLGFNNIGYTGKCLNYAALSLAYGHKSDIMKRVKCLRLN